MAKQHAVLQFLRHAQTRGEAVALIALTGVEGGAARGIGTLMGVTASGAWLGSLSGGCVESALVGEAQRVIAGGKAELLRLGAGSPLIDIRLPCGSGIDLLLLPDPDAVAVARACDLAEARRPFRLELGRDGAVRVVEGEAAQSGWLDETFHLPLDPPLRLVIAGHGEEVPALAGLARAWGAELLVLTPDERTAAACGSEAVLLRTPAAHPALVLDRWSALVMLFHDHDWETALLRQALVQEALFIGAMGSARTHANRLAALEAAGVPAEQAARVCGPIGLIPAARDPQTLALSVLSEVVAKWQSRRSA